MIQSFEVVSHADVLRGSSRVCVEGYFEENQNSMNLLLYNIHF